MKPILVVGASVAGSTAANALAKAGIPVVLLERDLTWVKPCGGALPPIAFSEFDLPERLISRKVHRTLVHSPSDRVAEVIVAGLDNGGDAYVAMTRREDLDPFVRERAVANGADLIEGKLVDLEVQTDGVVAARLDDAESSSGLVEEYYLPRPDGGSTNGNTLPLTA